MHVRFGIYYYLRRGLQQILLGKDKNIFLFCFFKKRVIEIFRPHLLNSANIFLTLLSNNVVRYIINSVIDALYSFRNRQNLYKHSS